MKIWEEIKAQTVDKNGVVLKDFTTESKPNNVDFSLSTTQGYVNGTKLVLPVVGNKGTAEVTYHTYKYDENAKEVGAITKKLDIEPIYKDRKRESALPIPFWGSIDKQLSNCNC